MSCYCFSSPLSRSSSRPFSVVLDFSGSSSLCLSIKKECILFYVGPDLYCIFRMSCKLQAASCYHNGEHSCPLLLANCAASSVESSQPRFALPAYRDSSCLLTVPSQQHHQMCMHRTMHSISLDAMYKTWSHSQNESTCDTAIENKIFSFVEKYSYFLFIKSTIYNTAGMRDQSATLTSMNACARQQPAQPMPAA